MPEGGADRALLHSVGARLRMTGQPVPQEFCEDCDGRTRLVTRAPELRSNDSLPAAFERAAGERIYEGLRNGFRVRSIISIFVPKTECTWEANSGCDDALGRFQGPPRRSMQHRHPARDQIPSSLDCSFQGQDFGAPAPLEPRTPIKDIAANAQLILDIFTSHGYALKVDLDIRCSPLHPVSACARLGLRV